MRGRLIGGNLNTLAGIWGSPFMPSIERGDILLLEDSLKTAETVERAFTHLKLCGMFDRIGALVLGKHELFDSQGSGRRPSTSCWRSWGADLPHSGGSMTVPTPTPC
jgi:muramoyltetrapeptide carboxypeptidase LdcA involved in peptidoglycan recycling